MGKRILVSENEKEQIRSLHENQKKEINYFQILENKVNKLLMEQNTLYSDGVGKSSVPELRPGETRDNGQITSTKVEDIKPITVDIETNFNAGVTGPYNPTPDDLKKLEGLVAWLNNPDLKTSSVEIKVNSGSSKTGNFEKNKTLAIQRGTTGINYLKTYLKDKIKSDVYSKIVFPEPTDVLANQGPEANDVKATAEDYKKFQKFQIIASAKGTKETKSTRDVTIELYKYPGIVDDGQMIFKTGNATKLAAALEITDEESIKTLIANWPKYGTTPVDDSAVSPYEVAIFATKFGTDFQFRYVTFCVKGFTNFSTGQYKCAETNELLGYRQIYATVNGGKRWLPYPSLDLKEGVVYSPFFYPKVNPILNDVPSQLCFLAEGYTGNFKPEFFKTIENSPFCQAKYSSWPNYNYKAEKREVPGPESVWYPYLTKTAWYTEGTTNGGLWTTPPEGKADTTKG